MRERFPASPEFRRLLRGDESADLVRINLEIARDADPEVDDEAALRTLDALADRVRPDLDAGASPSAVIARINAVLYEEDGFSGDVADYYDPLNSYLHSVLARRRGIPISLAILYAAVAERVGLRLDGVNTPLHFFLRITEAEPALFIDAFHEGAVLDRSGCEQVLSELSGREVRLSFEHFTPCDRSTIVGRMLRNLKRIYLERREYGLALPVVRRLAALQRRDLAEQRDWGLTALEAGRPGEAIDPLQRYLTEAPGADDAERVAAAIQTALAGIAPWN